MTRFSDFNEALLANAKRVDTKRKEDDILDKLASQIAVMKESQRIRDSNARRAAEREQQRIDDDAEWERSQRIRKKLDLEDALRLEDAEAQRQANGALLMFMAKRDTSLKEFDKLKTAVEAAVIRDPRWEDVCVEWMQKMGESAVSLSDVFRIIERNCMSKLVDDFIEEQGMSPKSKKHFSAWVPPLLQPRARRDIDDFKDILRSIAQARGGQGNHDLASALLPNLLTDVSPRLKALPDQNLMMAYQPHVSHLQVMPYNTKRDPDIGKKRAVVEHTQIIDRILEIAGTNARARRGPDGSLQIYILPDDENG